MRQTNGFTLIELLVVVTIIVVLLALLVPALDKAIYQAELVSCGAQLRGLARAATVYAGDFNRKYPVRAAMVSGNRQPVIVARAGRDDRPMIRNYLPLKMLIDPLTGPYPIEPSEAPPGDSLTSGNVYASYSLWFGFGYDGQPGMRKLGDRFEWTDDYNTPAMRHRFDLLATDFDFTGTLQRTISSHPDHEGILERVAETGNDIAKSYYARWEEFVAGVRGPVDLNYAYAGGHVLRLDAVTADDSRTAAVPFEAAHTNWSVYLLQLPRP